jgi:hypothetical protein
MSTDEMPEFLKEKFLHLLKDVNQNTQAYCIGSKNFSAEQIQGLINNVALFFGKEVYEILWPQIKLMREVLEYVAESNDVPKYINDFAKQNLLKLEEMQK